MPNKTQIYAQMADDTARKITGDYLDWAAFLNTSSRLYKYPFHDQLMIYAQRPDATACATYDLWNDTMRRYVRRGSKGIALLTPGPYGMDVRYVFDVSDTGTRRNSRNVEPWVLSDEAMEPVRQMLEDQYYADAAMGLEGQIDQIASRHWNTGGTMPVTSATAWTDLNLPSMMISASELPSGRPLPPASPTASRPGADWIRSCSGRISQRCWTGIPPLPLQSLARLSVRSAARFCARLKRPSE